MITMFRSLLALALFSGSLLFSSATPAATPTPVPWTAQCSDVIPGGTPSAESYTNCTTGPQWWTSYANCPITPVHTERYTGKVYPNEQALYAIPWLKLEAYGETMVAHLFYGNRPLPINATFPDQSMAKVLWQASVPLTGFQMKAISLSDESQATVVMKDFNSAGAADWASYVNLPKPGCWRVDVGGTTESGANVNWSAVFIVVE